MKKTKYRRLAAMAASLLCCLIFTVPAYAQSSEPQPETAPSPAETEAEPETQNPFTTDGTGTVVDNATAIETTGEVVGEDDAGSRPDDGPKAP